MNEYRRRVQSHLQYKPVKTTKCSFDATCHLEHFGSFIEVDHCEEQLVGIRLRIPKRVRDDHELVVSVFTDHALSLRGHRREHYDYGVVPRSGFDVVAELVDVKS